MEGEIKEVVKMAFSIILTSVIIIAAALFTDLSYRAYAFRLDTEAINSRIQTQSQLYNYFINPNSNISGSDIIDFISLYNKAYNYCIVVKEDFETPKIREYRLGNDKLEIYVNGVKEKSESAKDIMWTQSYLIDNILKTDLYSTFDGSIIDSEGKEIEDISEITNPGIWLKFEVMTMNMK